MLYSVLPRNRIFVKGYGFSPFAKNMDKNISNNLRGKWSQKLLDHARDLLEMHLKLLPKEQFKKLLKQVVI